MSEPNLIRIQGARTHNLRNVALDIPRNRLVVITGLSGSGKSSLAFDTLYAEGQRRYVESLSVYARQFLQLMARPDVDSIEGLSPAIAIEQKSTSHNPRSTVGTVTEILDYLRLLYARAGVPHCPNHPHQRLEGRTISQMVDDLLQLPAETKLTLLAPVLVHQKGEHRELLDGLRAQGYVRARLRTEQEAPVDVELDGVRGLNKQQHHSLDLIVDRLKVRPESRQRLAESLEASLRLGRDKALARIEPADGSAVQELGLSLSHSCPECGFGLKTLEPNLFSFNSPQGACPQCDGLGEEARFDPDLVVPMPELPISAGAIAGWDSRNPFAAALLEGFAEHLDFSLDTPFGELPEDIRHALLHGSGDVPWPHHLGPDARSAEGKAKIRHQPFEGILPSLARRFHESQEPAVKEELGQYRRIRACSGCQGSRLKPEARHVLVGEGDRAIGLPQLMQLSIADACNHLQGLGLSGARATVGERLLGEVVSRLEFLRDVGLAYLNLGRSAGTLSGGESQRIRLASQIGAGLSGVMYVLDEPSIGLHQRDNDRLLQTLRRLRDLGNSVIVVEHDEDAIRTADHVIDMGPAAGEHGGQVVAEGSVQDILSCPGSLTGAYLGGRLKVRPAVARKSPDGRWLTLHGARGHNLRNVSLSVPLGLFVCVTGVSGSGKSTLINETLMAEAARRVNGAHTEPQPFDSLEGLEQFDKVISVDQSPIGRTPRSNPATYTGLFTAIRDLFAGTPQARERGYDTGRFSFNVKGGRCEACQGDGMVRVEMHFLPDVYVPCDVCRGERYNRETLDIRYRGKNIAEVLNLTVAEGLRFFDAVPAIARRLSLLEQVGLGYIRLGQSATTLSGGEAQRVKLACELAKRDTGRTLYVLDEPTTGLHFHDTALLLQVLFALRDSGNTILVIEHNLDVIAAADHIIDMGPEGGSGGGELVAAGSPDEVMACERSHTGVYLRRHLNAGVR